MRARRHRLAESKFFINHKNYMKHISSTWWIVGIVVLVVGLFAISKLFSGDRGDVISRNGLHWHPQLSMYVKGEKIEIPANVGLGAVHMPMHTHTDLPNIHLEFEGVVREKDLMLGNFFRNWGKDMRSFGTNMTMTVNGAPNTEYDIFIMHDDDNIELRYE